MFYIKYPIKKISLVILIMRGGMLSHAAIIARELNIPCIMRVEHATDVIANGMKIKLDLQNDLVQKV